MVNKSMASTPTGTLTTLMAQISMARATCWLTGRAIRRAPARSCAGQLNTAGSTGGPKAFLPMPTREEAMSESATL